MATKVFCQRWHWLSGPSNMPDPGDYNLRLGVTVLMRIIPGQSGSVR